MKFTFKIASLILFALLVISLFYFIYKHRNKELSEQRWYVNNTEYNFCCKVEALNKINSRGGLGIINGRIFHDQNLQNGIRIEDSLQAHLKMFNSLRFIIDQNDFKVSDVKFTIPSTSNVSIGDTICVNSQKNSVYIKRGKVNKKIGEMTLCLEIDGQLPF